MPCTPMSLRAHEFEGLDHAAAGLLGSIEEGDSGLVGRRFLVLPIGKQAPQGRVLPAKGHAHACLAEPRGPCQPAPDHRGKADQLQHKRR